MFKVGVTKKVQRHSWPNRMRRKYFIANEIMFCVKIIPRQINRLQCRLKPKDGLVKNWCDKYHGMTVTVQSYEGKYNLEPMNEIMYRWTSTMLDRWTPAFADRQPTIHFFRRPQSLRRVNPPSIQIKDGHHYCNCAHLSTCPTT